MNNIMMAQVFQQELDATMIADAATGWMDGNASMAKYTGGREIKIPKISLDGLANYSRKEGYVEGNLSLEWETMAMTQDRGRSFTLDAMDVNESNFALSAGSVMGEFQRTKVVPEVDAYRISKINELAGGRSRIYSPNATSVFKELKADIATVQDKIGTGERLIILISIPVASILDSNESISRQLSLGDFEKGGIYTAVKHIDNHPLILVPSGRMKTAYNFFKGESAGDGENIDQLAGGFAAKADAKDINWVICCQGAPIGVCKTDTVRIFDPLSYQKSNAWRIDYRKYHDIWIPENKLDGVFVNRKG